MSNTSQSFLTFFTPAVRAHLRKDPALAKLLDSLADAQYSKEWRITAEPAEQYFEHLTREIIYQQLSGKAAGTIFQRFIALFPTGQLTPQALLAIPHESLRAVGLSNAKATYVHALAAASAANQLNFAQFASLDDETVIKNLTGIKGIGRWTAEMFLMFAMGRENVFSYGDLGLRKGFQRAYSLVELPTPAQMQPIVEQWSPYKTYAAVALWAILEI